MTNYWGTACRISLSVRRKPENSELLGDQLLGYRVYVRNLVCSQCEEGLGPITTMGRDATEATVGLLSKFYYFNVDKLKTKLKDLVILLYSIHLSTNVALSF